MNGEGGGGVAGEAPWTRGTMDTHAGGRWTKKEEEEEVQESEGRSRNGGGAGGRASGGKPTPPVDGRNEPWRENCTCALQCAK